MWRPVRVCDGLSRNCHTLHRHTPHNDEDRDLVVGLSLFTLFFYLLVVQLAPPIIAHPARIATIARM